MRWVQSSVGVILSLIVSALFAADNRVLVLLGKHQSKSEFTSLSSYLSDDLNVQSTIATFDDSDATGLLLMTSGKRIYDNLLVLSTNTPWTSDQLTEFLTAGGNVVWTVEAGRTVSSQTRSFAKTVGRVMEEHPSLVSDHFNNQDGDAALINAQIANGAVLGRVNDCVCRHAVSHKLDKGNPLVFPILSASASAVSVDAYGKDNVLISGLASRSGQRITFNGSLAIYKDVSFDRRLVSDLLTWTFGFRSVQRVESINARILNKKVEYHRIRDHVEIEVCLTQLDAGKLTAFLPADAQVELTMMTPSIRASLSPSTTNPSCLTTGAIQLPDRYGAYSLVFRYQRHGHTHLKAVEKLTVYPNRYDHTPRVAASLMPYYTAWISQLASSLLVILPALLWNRLRSKSKSKAE